MLSVRQHPSNGWWIARQLVADDHARLGAALTVEYPMQEPLGCCLIASVLDQDVEYDAMLIDGSPQPVAFAADLQRHLVQTPLVACSRASSTQPCRKRGSELGARLAAGLVADDEATLGEQILNVTEARCPAGQCSSWTNHLVGRAGLAGARRVGVTA
jgi:hypothetical protein